MSVLSDHSIRRALEDGSLAITPQPEDSRFQPASLDLTLGGKLGRYENSGYLIDPEDPPVPTFWDIDDEHPRVILAGSSMRGATAETVSLGRDLAAQVDGCSTLGRLGLQVHCTAGWIDPGFSGNITLELVNHAAHAIRLRAGMRIAQLVLHRLTAPADRPYGTEGLGSRYQGSEGPSGARQVVTVAGEPLTVVPYSAGTMCALCKAR